VEDIFHCARLDQSTTGSNASGVIADGKDMEEVDGVNVGVGKIWINPDVAAEGGPEGPVPVGGKGMGRYNAGLCCCSCSAEISVEFTVLDRWQSVQPFACG